MEKHKLSEQERIKKIDEILKRIKGSISYNGSGSQLITEIREAGTIVF